MPLGGKLRIVVKAPVPPPAAGKRALVRLPVFRPKVTVVEPVARPGSKQRTVIRYDDNGRYFIDEFVERAGVGLLLEGRRWIRYVECPKFYFTVALAVCHRYCSFPCRHHLETVQMFGWYAPPSTPSKGGAK